MIQLKNRETVFEPEIVTSNVDPVKLLMRFSYENHLGFENMGEHPKLESPVEEDGFIWMDISSFSGKTHPVAIQRDEQIRYEFPYIPIDQVVIGVEIEEESRVALEKAMDHAEEKAAAGVKRVRGALPAAAKVGRAGLGVGAVVAVGAALLATGFIVFPLIAALSMIDPKYVLSVRETGTSNCHWICIASWRD